MTLLALRNVKKSFGALRAVDGIDLMIEPGGTVGLVGESGCGKSTIARLALKLAEVDSGELLVAGTDVTHFTEARFRPFRQRIQLVQQTPHAALNPRRTIFDSIAEPLEILGTMRGKALRERVVSLAADVQLPEAMLWRFPHELSGGQKQRVCIARALALDPDLVILDEPTSALDVSVQAQILTLLVDLRKRRGLAFLFISHNLAVVRAVCERLAIMYLGQIVETGPVAEVFAAPSHPYTKALLGAVLPPRVGPLPAASLMGEAPSRLGTITGCRFAGRCPQVEELCSRQEPVLIDRSNTRSSRCHFA